MKKPYILGIIPARDGSKGLRNKNIRPFADKSLLQIAIEEANSAKLLTDCIVSTNSLYIARLAKAAGANVPFIRPKSLAKDSTPVWKVAKHVIQQYERKGISPDYIVILQPTSPLRTHMHIDKGIKLILNSGADALLSLSQSPHTPYKMRTIKKGYVEKFIKNSNVLQRQEAPPVYILNGIVYISRTKIIKRKNSLWGKRTIPYILPPETGINIDTYEDFKLAEILYRESRCK